ncbi:MAG: hypothetical protein DK304_000916 [Chloroflexi bacterium]|jgi:hypothetical protein|nr:MAG: hypothetical protein DK304_000916 [Chloroflexota bacterium]
MNIFFDTDYTWLGVDDTIRPGTETIFKQLVEDGHNIYVWSGIGIRWAEVRRHKLEKYVIDCFMKPLDNFIESLDHLGLPVKPDIVIDDYPEVPSAMVGIWIRPYFFYNASDNELERVYELICEYQTRKKSQ